MLLLLPGGTLPSPPRWLPQVLSEWLDSAVHGVLFFVLAWLLAWKTGRDGGLRRRLLIFSVCLGYATVLETAQIPVAGRSFEVVDIVFAAFGVMCALALAAHREHAAFS